MHIFGFILSFYNLETKERRTRRGGPGGGRIDVRICGGPFDAGVRAVEAMMGTNVHLSNSGGGGGGESDQKEQRNRIEIA